MKPLQNTEICLQRLIIYTLDTCSLEYIILFELFRLFLDDYRGGTVNE